jgi:hypothetical protein
MAQPERKDQLGLKARQGLVQLVQLVQLELLELLELVRLGFKERRVFKGRRDLLDLQAQRVFRVQQD